MEYKGLVLEGPHAGLYYRHHESVFSVNVRDMAVAIDPVVDFVQDDLTCARPAYVRVEFQHVEVLNAGYWIKRDRRASDEKLAKRALDLLVKHCILRPSTGAPDDSLRMKIMSLLETGFMP